MTRHEVRAGDEVSAVLRYSGIVSHVEDKGFILTGREADRPVVGWISDVESWLVETLTPAPEPFLLNEPITAAMGEPPPYSVIGSELPNWDAWIAVRRVGPTDRYQWLDLNGAPWAWSEIMATVKPILIRLGNGAD